MKLPGVRCHTHLALQVEEEDRGRHGETETKGTRDRNSNEDFSRPFGAYRTVVGYLKVSSTRSSHVARCNCGLAPRYREHYSIFGLAWFSSR